MQAVWNFSVSYVGFSIESAALLVILVAGSAFYWPRTELFPGQIKTTKEAVKEALGLMKDSTVWMAGIQTATIAALGIISKKEEGLISQPLSPFQIYLLVLVALFNTAALFCSAWILTALSSLTLRVYVDGLDSYDFYNRPLYSFMEGKPCYRGITLGFFAFWNHWLWALGILFFGALAISIAARSG